MASTDHDQVLLEHLAAGNAPPSPVDYDIITNLAKELVRRRASSDAIAIGLAVVEPFSLRPVNRVCFPAVTGAIGAIAYANRVARDGG